MRFSIPSKFKNKIRGDIEYLLPIIYWFSNKASRILEIGIDAGNGSTVAFNSSSLFRKSLYVSVDIENKLNPNFVPNNPNWHLILGDSTQEHTVNRVKEISPKFDLIFIDTIHTFEHLSKELPLWRKLADKNCVWLFHDVYMNGQYNMMTEAIKNMAKGEETDGYSGWYYVNITNKSNGLGALFSVTDDRFDLTKIDVPVYEKSIIEEETGVEL